MIDLDAEYLAALADTSPTRLRELQRAGVPQHAIDLSAPAYTRVRPAGDLFERDADSEVAAFILPVRAESAATPEALDPEAALGDGDIVDLVAFSPSVAARFLLRTGGAEWLGACEPQYLEPAPVALHRSPIDWLRADCRGLVCLARERLDILRFLTRFAAIAVADQDHADALRAIIEDRALLYPTIFIGGTLHG